MPFRKITPADVGKATFRAFGKSWPVSGFIGRIMAQDVGKRVYLVGDIVQVENDDQRDRRTKPAPAPAMVVECIDRRGQVYIHRCSGELMPREAMERLGVYQRPFKVTWWPDGRPDQAAMIQDYPA